MEQPMPENERIESLMRYLKNDYRDGRIDNYYYREYLTLLRDVTNDNSTKSKLDTILFELKGKCDERKS